MIRRNLLKLAALVSIVTVASAFMLAPAATALELQGVTTWYWVGYTRINSVVYGDVDADGSVEIITGGYYRDGTLYVAQLCVWSGSDLALKNVKTWYWTDDTEIVSVAIGDVDADASIEIVTGGTYYDGAREVAQLCVWDGSTLSLENVKAWYWGVWDTYIDSVAVGDVDGDGSMEIVTGGYWSFMGQAQLVVWDGATLAPEKVKMWYWTSVTGIQAVAIYDVDADGSIEIVTGGYHKDGVRYNAQLCVWSGASLALENVKTWYWIGNTFIWSLAVGDVDADGFVEIVTGGYHNDTTRYNAQLCVWSGSDLALKNVAAWYWVDYTYLYSVAVGDVDADGFTEIVTGGHYDDGLRYNAQLCVWSGSNLALEDVETWYWWGNTYVYSVAVGDVDADSQTEMITGGSCAMMHYEAQLAIWLKI